jgi:mannose-1-phosphate guanylyltransferase
MSLHIFILAGGKGQRLWPLSNQSAPKHLVGLPGHATFLSKTLERFVSIKDKHVFVLSSKQNEQEIQQLVGKEEATCLFEPKQQGTLAALVFGLKQSQLKPDDILFITPCDHFFAEQEELIHFLNQRSVQLPEHALILFGITPKKADSGYGYLKLKDQDRDLQEVVGFIEKPSTDEAQGLIEQGALYNSGLILTKVSTLLEQIQLHCPEYYDYYLGNRSFESLPTLSIDHGLLEKSSALLARRLNTSWSDMGSWDRVHEHYFSSEQENVFHGSVYAKHTKNTFVVADKPVALLGMEDAFVIDTPEGLLIGKKEHADQLKGLVEEMTKSSEL